MFEPNVDRLKGMSSLVKKWMGSYMGYFSWAQQKAAAKSGKGTTISPKIKKLLSLDLASVYLASDYLFVLHYEKMIDNLESVMRKLVQFLGFRLDEGRLRVYCLIQPSK